MQDARAIERPGANPVHVAWWPSRISGVKGTCSSLCGLCQPGDKGAGAGDTSSRPERCNTIAVWGPCAAGEGGEVVKVKNYPGGLYNMAQRTPARNLTVGQRWAGSS